MPFSCSYRNSKNAKGWPSVPTQNCKDSTDKRAIFQWKAELPASILTPRPWKVRLVVKKASNCCWIRRLKTVVTKIFLKRSNSQACVRARASCKNWQCRAGICCKKTRTPDYSDTLILFIITTIKNCHKYYTLNNNKISRLELCMKNDKEDLIL